MDFRKMLDLAARAADQERSVAGDLWSNARGCLWDPINDDGDALRLAVKLKIGIDWERSACVDRLACPKWYAVANQYGDVNKCTRMAIVRAAAQIGRDMP